MRVMQNAGVSVVVSLLCFGPEAVVRVTSRLGHCGIRIVGSFPQWGGCLLAGRQDRR